MADNSTIEIKGLDERIRQLGSISTKNPVMQRRINEVIRQVLQRVRQSLQNEARTGLNMNSDPRHAYKAVRMAVYRRLFGGQVNILQSRRHGSMRLYEQPRKLDQNPHQRGGNRIQRSRRTEDLMSYQGKDRGFVLRFLNQGTADRNTRYGHRGAIGARQWFGSASQREIQQAAGDIDRMIDDIVQGIMF